MSAILDAIGAAEPVAPPGNLDLYRKEVLVPNGAGPLRLSLLDLGPADPTQTLVLLHGYAATSAWWGPQLLPLAHHSRVIAPDLRGHGDSEWPAGGYSVSQLAADVAAMLDRLESRTPVVVAGHSAGGYIAARLALDYPERVSKLILVATPVRMPASSLPLAARLVMRLPDPVFRLLQPLYERDPKGRGLAGLVGLKHFLNDDLFHWDGEQVFSQIRQPALVIIGDRDYAFPPALYQRVVELLPHPELVNVGVSKHQVLFERPKAVLRAIERFVEPETQQRFVPAWRSENDNVNSIRLLAERPWVARYESNVPQVLDIPRVPLTRLLACTVRRSPNRTALRYGEQLLTYGELGEQVLRFAAALRQMGVRRGDRVFLLLPNWPHFIIALYGALHAGAVVVLGYPEAGVETLAYQAGQTGPVAVVIGEAWLAKARQALAGSRGVQLILAGEQDYANNWRRGEQEPPVGESAPVSAGEHSWPALLATAVVEQVPGLADGSAQAEDAAVISFASGAEQASPGVCLSHFNLVANALQAAAWLPPAGKRAETVLCTVPFSHVYGLTLGVNLAVRRGAHLALLADFRPPTVLEAVRQFCPTFLFATPQVYLGLNELSSLRQIFEDNVKICFSGVTPLPVEVKEDFERLARRPVIEGYGLSEASPLTHMNPVQHPRTGSIGLPLPGTQVQVVDVETGRRLPFGKIGELWVRGPQVMAGYWQDAAATRAVLDADGWLHTGDLAGMDDDGYFTVLGRRRDLWRDAAGQPVFARDVEETIIELPEVREVAVALLAGQPAAFLTLHAGKEISAEAVREFCQRRLPPSHVPARFIFVDRLPHSATGKILRDELTRRLA